jgi:hypothetical protein
MPDDIEDDEIVLENIAEQPASGQFIDEETIREIVGEMVRAELQGDLGDRITRNVRKLVRREMPGCPRIAFAMIDVRDAHGWSE